MPELRTLAGAGTLMYVIADHQVIHMGKIQIYLPREELEALRKAAARSGRSAAALVRDAIRKTVLAPKATGPVALWDGEAKRTSLGHDEP